MDPLRVRRPKRYWDRYVWISEEARERWRFLKGEVERNEGKRFRKGEGVKKIYTDASGEGGWGVVCVGERIVRVGGALTGEERKWHINKKELWVVMKLTEREVMEELGLREGERWELLIDNTVALWYV